MQFDDNGYLVPATVLPSSLAALESVFCFTAQRNALYANLVDLLATIQALVSGEVEVWVNGSFISKKLIPNDIDIVFFIDYQAFELLEKQFVQYSGFTYKQRTGLDCYFVRTYPTTHPYHFRYEFDRIEYLHLFSKTRRKQPKGFVSINLNS